ncbi:hypothetical protein B0H67DRAFT_480313 [Lasiosphaeris hirsuta]|uniref:DUF1857-domain-containing protein n=1 Tax=Lasiosphaeris hirsuta TaxID=260670 RepID=A0AA40AZI3_9PEZI|nr:hypothetical protein B0H67DRAFT_480313 [Lasiosphaeris hirsuta]
MVTFNVAYTAPINRPGQSPLTRKQVWVGLERKIHHPSDFVPIIAACEVISETEEDGVPTITRLVTFREGKGPSPDGGPVKEVCKHYPPVRADFFQENGTKVANYISQGPSGEPEDLFLTFVFEWRHPTVEAGSEQEAKLDAQHKMTARNSVETTIETIRKLVSEGTI